MKNENLIFPKLDSEHKKQIEKFDKKRKKLYTKSEEYRILYDWIKSFEKELYFAAFSIMRVFVEKSLRHKLILLNIEKKSNNKKIEKQYDQQEIIIENWINLWGGDSFNTICKKLYNHNFLDKEVYDNLKELYKDYRIPTQHWIYRRFIWKRITDIQIKKEIEKITKSKKNINNRQKRFEILPTIMANGCSLILGMINELISAFEENRNL